VKRHSTRPRGLAWGRRLLVFLFLAMCSGSAQALAPWVAAQGQAGDFALAVADQATPLVYAEREPRVVALAVADLAQDITRVTGAQPAVAHAISQPRVVVVGTLGVKGPVEDLIRAGRLDIGNLRGAWESFIIATVDHPWPGTDQALVIVGSDRRGTAYGVFELSQAIGVSPWTWWDDAPPAHQQALWVAAGTRREGPPSVKYRGIFINDEDWGLQPWAAQTFEPESGGIGPKTYARVFELLLRLKANTLWPAMHKVSPAFNDDPRNAALADDWAIVMGSSHAEPMLRNNVGEWHAPAADYNYATHRDEVLDYWRARVKRNADYENLYTLGMRGVHDSGMVGAATPQAQIALLEQIFGDQRALLQRYVNRDLTQVAQVFTPYKEVLDVYRAGLKVPDDVTLVWPDDNFGYLRQVPDAAERARSGGSGVYYHLSYLGAPLAYVWLSTTPPALIREEMGKAWDHGARRVWIANVGDIKPGEISTEFFLQLAWNFDRWPQARVPQFFDEWAAREFGSNHAGAIADLLREYYALNFARRPEHLQWWLPGEKPRPSGMSQGEIHQRLSRFACMTEALDRLEPQIAPASRDAFFELIDYPLRASAAANVRVFEAEAHDRLIDSDPTAARAAGVRARQADAEITALTRRYNNGVAGGKWRHFMAPEPADGQWKSFRISPLALPAESLVDGTAPAKIACEAPAPTDPLTIPPQDFVARHDVAGVGWREIPGLGASGVSMSIEPSTAQSVATAAEAPTLDYQVSLPDRGAWTLQLSLLPSQPLDAAHGLRLAVALDDAAPQIIETRLPVGSREWSQAVLDNAVTVAVPLRVAASGEHHLRIAMVDAGVVIEGLRFTPSGP